MENMKKILKNQKYMTEFQKFIDILDSVKDEKLRNRVIYQYFECMKNIKESK